MVIFYLELSQFLIMITMLNEVPGHTLFTARLRFFGELHNFEAVALHGVRGLDFMFQGICVSTFVPKLVHTHASLNNFP